MTGRRAVGTLAAVILACLAAVAGQSDARKLPGTYKEWLENEVADIIAPTEREVFLKLQTDRERDLFIEAFWKQRDPTPGTSENEFKTEHYRRLAYADRYFGRDAPRPGRRTDRGRIYIILGEPREIRRFEGKSSTYDAEIWFYQGKTDIGLPAGFNLVFFRPGGQGEYKLYSPVADGPQALLAGYLGGPDYAAAYERLRQVEPDLASVSLSLVPGETGADYGRPSMSSDLLIQRIESAPARGVEATYARKFLEYKDIVEVEYTANYLDSDSLVKVFLDHSGLYFVHYAVELRRLSVSQYANKYSTTLKVNGRVTASDGRLVHQFDKTVSLSLTEEQMKEASRVPFDFQDLFPLIGGDYSLSVLIKNEASKEFTSVEQALRVPQDGFAVQMTPPLLGYRAVKLEPGGNLLTKAFRLGRYQIYCQPNRVFTRQDTLALAFQINHTTEALWASGEVRIEFLKDGQPFRDIRRKNSDYPDPQNILEQVPLADFPPAHYTVRVSYANEGAEIVSASEEFDLSFAESIPRPWFSSRVLPDASDPIYEVIMGGELFNLGRYQEARRHLEGAFRRGPDSEDTAANLARVDLALGQPAEAARVLAPFVGPQKAAKYETLVLAVRALMGTNDFEPAAALLDRTVSRYGVNAALMNSLGACYEGLGRAAEALAAYEKSLQLSADQPQVRKRVDELKKKAPR